MHRLLIAVMIFIGGCQPTTETAVGKISFLHMPGTENIGLPFSSAVQVDNMLYLSGVIGFDEDSGGVIAGGIKAEARASMEIIKAELAAFGSSMDRIVKCTVFLVDENDRDAFNEIYMSYFDTLPARSGVTVKGLALGARVEIECMAVIG